MQEVVSRLSEGLVRRGHAVTVATSACPERRERCINGVWVEEFAISGNMVRGYKGDSSEVTRYQQFLCSTSWDVVVHFAAQQWATDLAFPVLDKISARKVLVPTGFSGLYLSEYQEYFRNMPRWMSQYDAVVLLSEKYRDASFAREQGISRTVVIPNGASEEEFSSPVRFSLRERLGITPDTFLILLVGSHTGTKGHREAVAIFDRARLSNATLLIVGKFPQKRTGASQSLTMIFTHAARLLVSRVYDECPYFCTRAEERYNTSPRWREVHKKVLIRELSREETVAAYHEASLFLFPSRIECSPIVLYEALASRTPFLATDVGNASEIAEVSGAGKILPTQKDTYGYSRADIEESSRMLEEMWKEKETRAQMAESGYRVWRERFTWEKIVCQYERLYEEIIAQRGGMQ